MYSFCSVTTSTLSPQEPIANQRKAGHYKSMKLHIVTVGEPKLPYAKTGWAEYAKRLGHYHTLRTTHLPDKHADSGEYFLRACGNAFKVALAVDGDQLSSPELAGFLGQRALKGRELCFMIGGPEGLPAEVVAAADMRLSLSALTFPHDLAMVVVAEALYRASSINAGHPYHK
jgi:23S rRNA (pseudouridine1915-N3)-methyltransferase